MNTSLGAETFAGTQTISQNHNHAFQQRRCITSWPKLGSDLFTPEDIDLIMQQHNEIKPPLNYWAAAFITHPETGEEMCFFCSFLTHSWSKIRNRCLFYAKNVSQLFISFSVLRVSVKSAVFFRILNINTRVPLIKTVCFLSYDHDPNSVYFINRQRLLRRCDPL